jgi:hypothetical protein
MAQPTSAAQLAQALAQTAAPTRGSVVQPFNQGISDTGQFTDAALANLRAQIGNTSAGYTTAYGQQSAQTQAAMARLAALGGQYGAGSAAAAGGMGDAAGSQLLQSGAAANAYANQIPGSLAARGQLLQAGLIKGRQQALQQRSQAISQAFPQYLSQVQAQRLAEKQFGLSQRQVADQEKQAAAAEAQSAASLAEQRREFGISNAYRYAALAASTAASSSSSGLGGSAGAGLAKALGWTSNELETHVSAATKLLQGSAPEQARVPVYGTRPDGSHYIKGYNTTSVGGTGQKSAVQAGVLFPDAVKTLIQTGVQPQVAVYAAARIYQGSHLLGLGYAEDRAYLSFAQFMAQHGNTKYIKIYNRLTRQNAGSSVPRRGH